MKNDRRRFLKATGTTLLASTVLGAGASTVGADDSFEEGQRVKTTANLVVHSGADLSAPQRWVAPDGSAGYVRGGPKYADGYTWWKVGFNAGHEGWCVQEYLTGAPMDGGDGGDDEDGGGESADRTIEGSVSSGGSKTYEHAPSSGIDRFVLDLAGPGGTDLDLYATVDGRTPSTKDFDRRSWSSDSDETIEVEGSKLGEEVGILVHSYHGGGEFTLTVTETGGDGDDGGEGDEEFDLGTRVKTTADLNVHTGPDLADPNEWLAPEGSAGYLRDGPASADGYTWWDVEFNAGERGWCVQEYLTVAPADGGGGGDGRSPLPFDVETDLTEPVAVTGSQLDDAIAANQPDSPLVGLGDTWVAAQEEYSVNAVYQASHAILESNWGRSRIAQDKRNIYGWGAVDSSPYEGARPFDTFEDCVWYVMGEVADLYLEPGNWRYNGPTLDGMNVYYATDDRWAEKIAEIYRRIADDL